MIFSGAAARDATERHIDHLGSPSSGAAGGRSRLLSEPVKRKMNQEWAHEVAAESSLDGFIRAQQDQRWDEQIEGMGGLEIDVQGKLGRPLDGTVAGPSTSDPRRRIDLVRAL